MKKYRRVMTLKSDAKFEEKLTLGSKNDTRNLVYFNASSAKSENCTLMGYFCRKYVMFELKTHKSSCVMKNDFGFKNYIRNLVNKY